MAQRNEYGTTWWGKEWLKSLDRIDIYNRIDRGRSYANRGFVLDTFISGNTITAIVKGHYRSHYNISWSVKKIAEDRKKLFIKELIKHPLIIAKLANHELDPEVYKIAERLKIDVFPTSWQSYSMRCSCPDFAVPCKHIAAVIHKVSQEIDADPFLLFSLLGIEIIKELEKQNINFSNVHKIDLPSWPILDQYELKEEPEKLSELEQQYNACDPEDYSSQLRVLSFFQIPNCGDRVLNVLSDRPAGYVSGSLKDRLFKIFDQFDKKFKKLKKSNDLERVPDFNGNEVALEINKKGEVNFKESIWNERSYGKNIDLILKNTSVEDEDHNVECTYVAIRSKTPTHESLCKLTPYYFFTAFLPSIAFEGLPFEFEFMYSLWAMAVHMVSRRAVQPEIYMVESGFRVRWIPAIIEPEIKKLTYRIGSIAQHLTKKFIKLPKDVTLSNLELGKILLGIFISDIVQEFACELEYIYRSFLPIKKQNISWQANTFVATDELFNLAVLGSSTIHQKKTKSNDQAATRLYQYTLSSLESWLDPYLLSEYKVKAVLLIKDYSEETNGVQEGIGLEIGFSLNDGVPYHSLEEINCDPKYSEHKFECIKLIGKLTGFCELISRAVEEGSKSKNFDSKELATLMQEILPSLAMLGVTVVLPKSLKKLMIPRTKIKLDLDFEPSSVSFVSLSELLKFEWSLSIGDQKVTEEEFAKLLQHSGEIVKFKNSYVFLDPEQLAKLANQRKKLNGKISNKLLMAAAIAGNYDGIEVELGDLLKENLTKLFGEKEVPLPEVHATLRPYQVRGFSWLYKNAMTGIGSILADDMGLGKTLQVITTIAKLKEQKELESKKVLVIVPKTLIINWEKEIEKFAPNITTYRYYGTSRSTESPDFKEAKVVLTTYGSMRTSFEELEKLPWRLKIIDEAQAIKNHKTTTHEVVKKIKADAAIAMSGTPVENRVLEYWSVMDFANPGLLGTANKFASEVAIPIEREHDPVALDSFKRLTSPFIMRRLKTDKTIISDLPDKIVTDQYCTLTKEQASLYQSQLNEVMKRLKEQEEEGMDLIKRQAMVLELITKLKQICDDPALFMHEENSDPTKSGKAQYLFELIDSIFNAGRKVLIFTQYRTMGEILQKWLFDHYGEMPDFIHGGLSAKQRQDLVDRFQEDRSNRFMVLSLKAAGTGLNLTAASAVIHYDLWWNPAVENQATDRVYRIGQKHKVDVYRFICQGTFEERIDTMITAKLELAELTVASGENWIGNLSTEDLNSLLTLSNAMQE